MITMIQIEENIMSAIPCKICNQEPIFPFEPKFVKQDDKVLMEYYIYSKCDCRMRYVQQIVKFTIEGDVMEAIKSIEHVKPAIEEWNRLNA